VNAVLVIAGTDSSGGAGLARDLATLHEHGTRALCAVTAVTAQSDARLFATHVVPAPVVAAQIEAAFESARVAAVKVGMLANRATVRAVAAALQAHPAYIVLDPVLAASSGGRLLDAAGEVALRELLLPMTAVLTPNIPEAAQLLGTAPAASDAQMLEQARALLELGPRAVLLKGGHGGGPESVDVLMDRDGPRLLKAARLQARCRGTGCALASSIAASLAAGLPLEAACRRAKEYVIGLLRR
jgi:hydroxymethylpyrimidine/phosphomethylpyrimidine kinase